VSGEETDGNSGDHTDRHGADYNVFSIELLVHVLLLDD